MRGSAPGVGSGEFQRLRRLELRVPVQVSGQIHTDALIHHFLQSSGSEMFSIDELIQLQPESGKRRLHIFCNHLRQFRLLRLPCPGIEHRYWPGSLSCGHDRVSQLAFQFRRVVAVTGSGHLGEERARIAMR